MSEEATPTNEAAPSSSKSDVENAFEKWAEQSADMLLLDDRKQVRQNGHIMAISTPVV